MKHLFLATLLVLLAPMVGVGTARAADNASRDAAKHFQRGVDLYNDGDFRGALVEFKKAYDVWPRANVLYDIGQTEFQLLDYASALRTMERYLAETGANAPHRSEVEASVETLRGRVGRVVIASESNCDVTVDDAAMGSTSNDAPILVSVGPRRLTVTCPGGRSVTKRVEVVAGETMHVELHPPAPAPAAVRAAMAMPAHDKKPSEPGKGYVTGWIVSGVLVAATAALGATTLVEQNKLGQMRNTFPITHNEIDNQTALTTGLAITSDVLGAASIVAVGVSTYLTIRHERAKHIRVGLSAQGVQVGGVF